MVKQDHQWPPSGLETWPAPGKLNLFLHITGRRPDGYHLLQTVFQLLDYSDELAFQVRDDTVIDRPLGPDTVAVEQDLTVRAAKLLQQTVNPGKGADIYINKHLPMGGGLGGGSSDAATTLLALNHYWACGLTSNQLAELGQQLGADVPVFVHGHSAWAEGIGERLQALDLPVRYYVVIRPDVEIKTTVIFATPELTRDCKPITIPDFLESGAGNVFEPVVRSRYIQVAEALDWLCQYAPAKLTGTGSCVFAGFDASEAAEKVIQQLPKHWTGFLAKGINQSPLFSRLENQK